MTRRRVLIGVAVLTAVAAFAVPALLEGQGGGHRSVVAAPSDANTAPTGCAAGTPAGPPPAAPVAPAAHVTVPGAAAIDTKGLVPGAVTETSDGATWAIVRDPNANPPGGMIARVDPAGRALTEIIPVVTGCTVTAITGHGTSVWVATCNPAATGDTPGGAELVRVDAPGQIGVRVPLPAPCLDALAAGATTVWATSAARSATAPRLFRLDVTTGRADPVTVGPGEQVTGLATVGDDLWSSRAMPGGSRLVRVDGHTGAVTASVPTSAVRLLGLAGHTLWTEDDQHATLAGYDAQTGAPGGAVPVPNLQAAAVDTSGVWYEQASTASLQITIGKLTGALPTPTVTFTGAGPDRTGLPFLGTLTATGSGAWLANQDHLFLIGAPPGP
ncbi:MAG TPA: hypothetical protein VLV81_05615 [Acidimicrobiia bacterium]|nr:hypothetical protein [Acidimicrobiia bacterium]